MPSPFISREQLIFNNFVCTHKEKIILKRKIFWTTLYDQALYLIKKPRLKQDWRWIAALFIDLISSYFSIGV
jgi:hypothetical protein